MVCNDQLSTSPVIIEFIKSISATHGREVSSVKPFIFTYQGRTDPATPFYLNTRLLHQDSFSPVRLLKIGSAAVLGDAHLNGPIKTFLYPKDIRKVLEPHPSNHKCYFSHQEPAPIGRCGAIKMNMELTHTN